METIREIYDLLNEKAPVSLRMEGDNVGLLAGHWDAPVTKVLIALDITPEVIDECVEWGAELILTHHPVIYKNISRVTDRDFTGYRLLALAENRIAAICMHSNLDIADGGVNDVLAERIGLKKVRTVIEPVLSERRDRGVCRMGQLDAPQTLEAFAQHVRDALGGNGVKYITANREVKTVAVGGGSCGDEIALVAAEGCDTFVTSELKHSQMLEARWLGVNLIDAGHFPTEDVICPVLGGLLTESFPELQVRKAEWFSDPAMYLTK